MAKDFLKVLKAEIAALEGELGKDPRFVRLQALMQVLEVYMDDPTPTATPAPLPSAPEPPARERVRLRDEPDPAPPPPRPSLNRARSEKTQEILDVAETIIKGKRMPTSTSVLLKEIEARGITVPGKVPANNLSATLSYSEMFKSHGRLGWTMADEPATNTEATDDPNLAGGSSAASAEHRPTSGGTAKGREAGPGGGT